jgi:hypothetical protein
VALAAEAVVLAVVAEPVAVFVPVEMPVEESELAEAGLAYLMVTAQEEPCSQDCQGH